MRTAFKSVLAALLIVGLATPAMAADTTPRGVTVSATGSVKVVPDAATLNFSVSIQSATSAIALDTVNSLQKQARSLALSNGIDSKNIRTTSISIFPEYQYYSEKTPVLVGYRATQSTNLTSFSVSTIGTVIDGLAALSSDIQIGSISLFVSKPAKYEQRARTLAVASAKTKAASYARLLGRQLGTVRYLNESSAPISPIMVANDFAKGEATVIDAGQQTISVTVEVRWNLR